MPGTHRVNGRGTDDRRRTRAKREAGEMSQRARRDRYGAKAKGQEVGSSGGPRMGRSEEPRAVQEPAYSYCLWLKALVVI